jgi:AcrR family transcriptional regulator
VARQYRLKHRAEQMDETRRRITEAAVELHGTVGPAQTTVTAIAERAGVQRLTVYRHFADEHALFAACSSHWLAQHPPPDPSAWLARADAQGRLELALGELYDYYAGTAAMWERVLRDVPVVPALQAPVAGWFSYLDGARDLLAEGWHLRGTRRNLVRLAVRHAIDFSTWASLTRVGADRAAAVKLLVGLVLSAAGTAARPRA